MITSEQELQAREFLKRAEVRTMKKDLRKLRELDALAEKEQIIKMKSTQEEAAAQNQRIQEEIKEKENRENILQASSQQEDQAKVQLKEYAKEAEKQKIFILESQRIELADQIKKIKSEKEPGLFLTKNELSIEKKKIEERLALAIKKEESIENEEAVLDKTEQESNIPAEKKSLEQKRWDIESQRKEAEKNRWAIEKELSEITEKIAKIDQQDQALLREENDLLGKIKEVEDSLREVYFDIMEREKAVKAGELQEQKEVAKETAKEELKVKENIQRNQWTKKDEQPSTNDFANIVPDSFKVKMKEAYEKEEEQRKKFLEDVENKIEEK